MSANKKTVFFSNKSLNILGSFSSGRLNAIIERYENLIQIIKIDDIFLDNEFQLLYTVCKESAIKERTDWQEFRIPSLIEKINNHPCEFETSEIILKLNNMNSLQELSLIEKIERYWLEERVKLFNEYRNKKNPL